MRALPAIAFVVVFAGTAAAFTVDPPPARYDRSHPDLVVIETAHNKVRSMCGRLLGHRNFERSGRLHACASIGDGRSPCIVVLPTAGEGGISKRDRQALFRHERAHCNGWPGHHP
jgi:hypothetical protein